MERRRAFAGERIWTVAPERLYQHEGASSMHLDRPALDRLRAAIPRGGIDVVLATDAGRLAGDDAALSQVLAYCGLADLDVIFARPVPLQEQTQL